MVRVQSDSVAVVDTAAASGFIDAEFLPATACCAIGFQVAVGLSGPVSSVVCADVDGVSAVQTSAIDIVDGVLFPRSTASSVGIYAALVSLGYHVVSTIVCSETDGVVRATWTRLSPVSSGFGSFAPIGAAADLICEVSVYPTISLLCSTICLPNVTIVVGKQFVRFFHHDNGDGDSGRDTHDNSRSHCTDATCCKGHGCCHCCCELDGCRCDNFHLDGCVSCTKKKIEYSVFGSKKGFAFEASFVCCTAVTVVATLDGCPRWDHGRCQDCVDHEALSCAVFHDRLCDFWERASCYGTSCTAKHASIAKSSAEFIGIAAHASHESGFVSFGQSQKIVQFVGDGLLGSAIQSSKCSFEVSAHLSLDIVNEPSGQLSTFSLDGSLECTCSSVAETFKFLDFFGQLFAREFHDFFGDALCSFDITLFPTSLFA